MKTQAIRIYKYGGPEVLKCEEVNLVEPGLGEARVRHTAIGLNFIDTYHRTGLYPQELPTGLGTEAAGIIEAVGPGVTEVKPGDRVVYLDKMANAYSGHRNFSARQLVPVPDGLSDEKAELARAQGCDHIFINTRERLLDSCKELFDVIAKGILSINVNQRYALKDARQAHIDLEARKTTGSTVLIP